MSRLHPCRLQPSVSGESAEWSGRDGKGGYDGKVSVGWLAVDQCVNQDYTNSDDSQNIHGLEQASYVHIFRLRNVKNFDDEY